MRLKIMEDAVRPNEQAVKAMFERGYHTWSSLHDMAIADPKGSHWRDNPLKPENVFCDHPSFPKNLATQASFSNTVIVSGISTWKTTGEQCDISTFDQEFIIPVASDEPAVLVITDLKPPGFIYTRSEDNDHTTLLILAWTYILSARWAELIPKATSPAYTKVHAKWDSIEEPCDLTFPDSSLMSVDLGEADDDAARWWSAVLAIDGGWETSVKSDRGHILHSPWYSKIVSKKSFILSRAEHSQPLSSTLHPPSYSTSLSYLSHYCKFHNVVAQSEAALAATLLLPVARYNNSFVQLPTHRNRREVESVEEESYRSPAWSEKPGQLDRLLTLSCNVVGVKALLNSIFFEPGVECNICGIWLQGTFAFLDSEVVQNQDDLLNVLIKRDPSLSFLWLGASISGVHTRALQEARQAWWKIDLHTAAWTGTLMSFIQEPTTPLSAKVEEISRAGECRLMYLSHDQPYSVPPLFAFGPFGFTAKSDVNIDVRQHFGCQTSHALTYNKLRWKCSDGLHEVILEGKGPTRTKRGYHGGTSVPDPFDLFDEEDDSSEMVTRNLFTWLRDEDGFPVAERAI